MGEGAQFIDIILFGAIALFLIFRLRSELGRRHGGEKRRPNPYASHPQNPGEDKVVTLGERRGQPDEEIDVAPPGERPGDEPGDEDEPPTSLPGALTRLKIADPGFDEERFLTGARSAFEMIVDAFAKGDMGTLQMLVEDDLLRTFRRDVERRAAAGQQLDNRIIDWKHAAIEGARMAGSTAYVTVRFITVQSNILRDSAGMVIEGEEDMVEDIIDVWVFARNLRSDDPNWLLVETRSEG